MKRLLGLILAIIMVLGITVPALAATAVDVTITFTVQNIALTNSEATWAVGTILVSSTTWWTAAGTAPDPEPFEANDMKSTITNTGNVAEDIDAHSHNSTGGVGMTLSTDDSPAASEFSLRAGRTGTANEAGMIQVITTDVELSDNLAASGTIAWCMELEMGPSAPTDQQTTTVTLTARAHS